MAMADTITGSTPFSLRLPSLRTVLQILFAIAIWYGSDGASASYQYYPHALDDIGSMTLNEVLVLVVSAGAIVLLIMRGDIGIPKSRLHIPTLIFFLTVFIPWVRMCYMEGAIRIPYEMHRTMGFFSAYILVFILFERSEAKKLFLILLGIGIAKGLEACIGYILQPTADSSWAALSEWRDGLVQGMMLISWLIMYCYRNEISRSKFVFATAGFLITAAGFIVSIRRSFIYGLPLACMAMLIGLDSKHKKNLFRGFWLLIGIATAWIFVINPTRFLTRLAVVGNPMEEWSTAYRIYELKNVLLTVADSPWIGYPLGVPYTWHTLFPLGEWLSPLAAHDVYLNILLRNGIFGLGIMGFYIFVTGRSMIACVKNARTTFEKICSSSIAGWWALFLIASFTAPLLTVTRSAIIGGLIIALTGLLEEPMQTSPPTLKYASSDIESRY